jgi:hypothetical protein
MNDPRRNPTPASDAVAGAASAPAASARWQALVAEIGAEISGPLTLALERIHALTNTGRIDRDGLRALRSEVESARQAGMIGQQLARYASGRIRQSHERLGLAEVLDGVINHRSREFQARGIRLHPLLKPAEVIVDATLLFSLINATLDWALIHASKQVDLTIEVRGRPARACLSCRYVRHESDAAGADAAAAAQRPLETLAWRLVEQIGWAMGLPIECDIGATKTTLNLEFPRTVGNELEGVSTVEIDDGFAPSANSQPLAGSHVLVVASRRALRAQVRDALRHMSMIVDYVASVDEAAAFCREGLPHALIIESVQTGAHFTQLREEIASEVPEFVFIEIVEEGSSFEMSGFSGSAMARIGRDAVASSLASALVFELSRGL